jgi:hypothetical protein
MVQLSVWVAAQFKKLQALSSSVEKRLGVGIPLLSVEGHDWKVHVAYQQNDGSIVCVASSLDMASPLTWSITDYFR